MADGFLSGVFDRLGDVVDGISGKTDSKNLQAQLAQQADINEQILALQKQEIAFRESPDYLKQQRIKIIIASVVFLIAVVSAVLIMRFGKD